MGSKEGVRRVRDIGDRRKIKEKSGEGQRERRRAFSGSGSDMSAIVLSECVDGSY